MSLDENVLIPEEMDFENPPMLPVSRSYQRLFPVLGGSEFREGQVLEFKIPPSDRCYLGKRSYLSMDIHAKFVPSGGDTDLTSVNDFENETVAQAFQNTSVLAFDKCGSLGCIDKIQVLDFSGVNLLEDTSGNGQLMCLLRDLNTGLFESQFHGSFIGTSPSFVSPVWNKGLLELSGFGMSDLSHYGSNLQEGMTGDVFLKPLEKTMDAYNGTNASWPYLSEVYRIKSVVIPLFSFLGLLSDQMVPLHNGFTIRFTLNSNQNAFTFTNPYGNNKYITTPSATNVNAKINDIFYNHINLVCDYYELSPLSEQLIRSTRSSDEMVVHTKAYRRNEFFMKPEQKEFSYTLNANLKSIRNLIWFTRPMYSKVSSSVSSMAFPRLSNRVRNYISEWWLTINNEILPSSHSKITCGVKDGETIVYPNKTLSKNVSASGTYNVITNRSAQSMYHLMNTQSYDHSKYNSLITKDNYEIDDNLPIAYPLDMVNTSVYTGITAYTQYVDNSIPYTIGKFAAGLNLQARPYSSVNTMSGTDFTEKVVRLQGTRSNTTWEQSGGGNVVDVFAEYDAFIHIVPGQITTVLF